MIVETENGPVRGACRSEVWSFKGIPYASAPTAERRFGPPEPAPVWDAPRDATAFGSAAPQNPDSLDHIWGERLAPGDEDCLTLNIWTPSTDHGQPKPVMVWIHGGAFVIGSGRWGWCDGGELAKRGEVVVVTINYRLGVLGFLDLSEVGDSRHASSGNHGLLDQIAALRWIRANIARFGGDPNNVTIFGESAGAISVSSLLATPRAQGLFHNAIVMSGGANLVRTPETSRAVTRSFFKLARVDTVSQLQALPTKTLLSLQQRFLNQNEFGGDLVFGPVVDGLSLPEHPLHAVRAGRARRISLLTGTTMDEARLWALYVPLLRWSRPRGLENVLRHTVGERWREVISTYERARPNERPGNLAMAINGDLLFRMPAIRLAEAQAVHRPHDTRMYLFSWRTPTHGGRLGAPHAVDLPFIFGNLEQRGVQRYIGSGSERLDLSRRIQDAWIAFARGGDPNHAGLPHWPAYHPNTRATMVFDNTTRLENDPRSDERRVWGSVPFDGVSPAIEKSVPTTSEVLHSLLPAWRTEKSSTSEIVRMCVDPLKSCRV